jgi:hypothetical protein
MVLGRLSKTTESAIPLKSLNIKQEVFNDLPQGVEKFTVPLPQFDAVSQWRQAVISHVFQSDAAT